MFYQTLADGQTSDSALFVHHAEQLKAPQCHIIYTVPVWLVFNVNLGDAFAETDLIPMVKVFESDGQTPSAEGRRALFEVVARRVNVERVFEKPEIVERLVEMSGGSIRDLLRLVRFACDETDDRIALDHCEAPIRRLIRDYDQLVRDEDIERLRQVHRLRRVAGDDIPGRLLHLRLVLEYQNHQRWADLHPAVLAIPRVREWLER
ncbi:MAG: hypothetical protein HYY30_14960 [Chloroflexi bacterium]|nr:hypothetical protein [Chloroflexota bacterium]